MNSFDKLVAVIESTKDDVVRTDSKNKAAGVRVRKAMQEVKALAQEVRQEVSTLAGD